MCAVLIIAIPISIYVYLSIRLFSLSSMSRGICSILFVPPVHSNTYPNDLSSTNCYSMAGIQSFASISTLSFSLTFNLTHKYVL